MELVFIWTCVLTLHFGATTRLPDDIEDINTLDSYACYGCNAHLQPSCEHKPNTVIGVQAIKVGAKPRDLNCPDVIASNHSEECNNATCCLPDVINDCIGVYDYLESETNYRFHSPCSGKSKCTNTLDVERDQNVCDDHAVNDVSNYTYNKYTNYFYMEYACIKQSVMIDMCRNDTYYSDNSTLYLHTPLYPDDLVLTMSSNCTCVLSAEADLKLDAYLIDVQLDNVKLTIDDGRSGLFQYDVMSATYYNITKNKVWNGAFITLENLTDTYSGTKVWLGIKAQTGGPFNITCQGPSTGESSVSSTSTTASSITSTNSISSSSSVAVSESSIAISSSTFASPTTFSPSSSTTSIATSTIPFNTSSPSTPIVSTPSNDITSSVESLPFTVSTPSIPSVAPVKERNNGGGLPIGIVVGAVIGLLLLLLLLLCCCLYRCFKRKKRQKEKQPPEDEENADNDTESGEVSNAILDEPESKPTMNNNFITPLWHNKVAPTPFIEEHGGLGLQAPALPPIAAIAPAATTLLLNGGHRHLKPIEVPSVREKTDDPPRKKNKKKKRRKRKDKLMDTSRNNVDIGNYKKSDPHLLNKCETDA